MGKQYQPPISRETFIDLPADGKLNILFDMHIHSNECVERQQELIDALHEKMQKKIKTDFRTSAVFGFVGGFVAMGAKWIGVKIGLG